MRKYILSILFILPNFLFAVNPVDVFVDNYLLRNANVSLLVKDLSNGSNLYEFRPNNGVVPASTMKVVTTATALELFGGDFRFETCLEIDGNISKDSVLNGNLYIRGGGDPTLGSEKIGTKDFMPQWLQAIKKAGIKQINGQIISDVSLYDDEGVNPRWIWEDIGNYYAPGIYGISYLDNAFKLVLYSGKIGSTPQITKTIPEIPGLVLENHLKSTTIAFDSAYFYGAPHSSQRVIYGAIPANRSSFIVKGDIPNPGLLLAQHLYQKLLENKFIISGLPTDKYDIKAKRQVIYKYYSPSLAEIIKETNYKSNNHFAEAIFRYIGTRYEGTNASANASIRVIHDYWKSRLLPVSQLVQYDGSGLSPTDMVSANFFVELLTYMDKVSKNKTAFFNSLPVSGESGTLATFLEKTPLKGKVHAKSGTLAGVKCYAGYIDKNGKKYAFALLVNNANGSSKSVIKKMEEFLLSI